MEAISHPEPSYAVLVILAALIVLGLIAARSVQNAGWILLGVGLIAVAILAYGGHPHSPVAHSYAHASASFAGEHVRAEPILTTTDRPGWVGQPPARVGGTYSLAARSDLFATLEECYDDLDGQLETIAARYADDLLGEGAGARLQLPASYVYEQIATQTWVETVESETLKQLSAGPVYRVHVLLKFGPEDRDELRAKWSQRVYQQHRNKVLKIAMSVLACLGTALAYFKLDTFTKGFYTRRLQLAAVVVILAILAMLK